MADIILRLLYYGGYVTPDVLWQMYRHSRYIAADTLDILRTTKTLPTVAASMQHNTQYTSARIKSTMTSCFSGEPETLNAMAAQNDFCSLAVLSRCPFAHDGSQVLHCMHKVPRCPGSQVPPSSLPCEGHRLGTNETSTRLLPHHQLQI